MSYLKFSPELFLEQIELNRFKKFIDDDGFRLFLLENTVTFGLIKKDIDFTFTNGRVIESAGLTIQHNALRAIDVNGNYIKAPVTSLIPVTADNTWKWVKVKYVASPIEEGTFSIDTKGNLVGVSSELTKILRGNTDFPSRVVFSNAVNNTLEYDVMEVIDDNNAILQGASFIAETDLKLTVVGTFTPGSTPIASDKQVFQYDSYELSLVAETVLNEPPTKTANEEFYLARVKSDGVTLLIEDKRNEIYETKADYNHRLVTVAANPLLGVEKIVFDGEATPKYKNHVYVNWSFRSFNWSINTNNNTVTINAGEGGRYKDTSQFIDNDFNGWRLYYQAGDYVKITSSIKSGSQINLTLDQIDPILLTIDSVQELIITPDAEEIELIFTPDPNDYSASLSSSSSSSSSAAAFSAIVDKRFVFPINCSFGKCALTVYKETNSLYNLKYRYKTTNRYSQTFTPQSDATGFYNENQFTIGGDLIETPNRTTYISSEVSGFIPLIMDPSSYSLFAAKIDTGDLFGVDVKGLSNTTPVVTLRVGTDKQYQLFSGTDLILAANMFIDLKKLLVDDETAIRDGNNFILHFKQKIIPSTFKLYIVHDYVDAVTYTTLKEFTQEDYDCASQTIDGLVIRVTFDKDNDTWVVASSNHGTTQHVRINGNNITTADGNGATHELALSNILTRLPDTAFNFPGNDIEITKSGWYDVRLYVLTQPSAGSTFLVSPGIRIYASDGVTLDNAFFAGYSYASVSAGSWPSDFRALLYFSAGSRIRPASYYANLVSSAYFAAIGVSDFHVTRIKP